MDTAPKLIIPTIFAISADWLFKYLISSGVTSFLETIFFIIFIAAKVSLPSRPAIEMNSFQESLIPSFKLFFLIIIF